MLPHPTLTNRYADTEGKPEFVNQLFDKGPSATMASLTGVSRIYSFLSGLYAAVKPRATPGF